jgi:hypothetical protein
MEITAIVGNIGIRSPRSLPSPEKISTPIIENNDGDGGNRSGRLNKVDSNSDIFVNQNELFTALTKRIEERNNTSIQISLNINVIKANLGTLLSSTQNQSDSDTLTNLFTEDSISTEVNQSSSNVRERYINALITSGIEDGGLFNSSSTLSTNTENSSFLNPLAANQGDGRQLLFNLLVQVLGTPAEDALAILNTLQSQSFQTVA